MLENDNCEVDNDEGEVEDGRISVINLLLQGLAFPAPSLSHFLLGFDLRSISRSTIQQPGTVNHSKTKHLHIKFIKKLDI